MEPFPAAWTWTRRLSGVHVYSSRAQLVAREWVTRPLLQGPGTEYPQPQRVAICGRKFTSTFGAIQTEPSGNDGLYGTGSGHITDSCVAYDVICVGGVGYGDPATTGDDLIANLSSRGPSPAGRKKPDLVAIAAGSAGGANMTVVEQRYGYYNRLERGDTGTSFASPQVAGAAALLYGAGITDPLVVKATLLDSTTLGRSTPSAEMGTQTTWQPDWGWGELNLDSAYRERLNFAADGVGPRDVRFYRAAVNAGDRATLVWNRRVAGAPDQTAVPQALTLSNLNLHQYDGGPSQAELSSSQSTIDNVEQVRGTTTGTVVYKVKDESSTVDGATAEPFALAAKNPLTPLASPKPVVTITLDRPAARRGDEVTVTETVHNPSADIPGSNAGAELTVPPGVTLTSGGSTTWSPAGGSLTTDATASRQWTVQGTKDGIARLTATAKDDAYGETFESQASTTLRVDSTPPSPAISCPHPVGTDPRTAVSWDATDSSTVIAYDVDISTDGGPYSSWLAGTGLTSATYDGLPGHYYELRLRATDDLGNISGYVFCGPVAIGFAAVPPPSTPLPPATSALPASPHLKLTSARRRRGRLVVEGRLASTATGRLTWRYLVHGHRAVHGRVPIRHGRFHLTVRLPRGTAHARGFLRIEYRGDRSFAPQHISRRIK